MCQLIEKFNLHVQDVGFEAWDVFVVNVQKLSRFYGMHNAFKRRRKIKALATLLGRCNALLSFWPMDEQLLDIYKILSTSLCDMKVKSYQQARLHKLRQEVDDSNCQSHEFFHALHESHARYNVVRLQENGRMIMDPHMIVKKCVDYYKQLLDVETHVDETVNYAREVFLNEVINHVSIEVSNVLDSDISEVEVESVISHLVNGKSPGWDGLTNEFFKKYNTQLKRSFAILFQNVWSTGHMPQSWKIGLIKLLPKVPSPVSFAQWRPISLMGGIYKIFTKILANRLHKVLPTIIHNAQYGFLANRDILHNILNVQMAIDFAMETKQEIVMLQLDLEKAYDHVNWSFLCQVMHRMGFGDRMSNLIYTLGDASMSYVMLNGGVTQPISVRRSVRQGCPLSPLLFTIVTHSILVKLHNMTADGDLVGLILPSGRQCIAQALADDHFMFLGATCNNVTKATKVWELFSLASGLKINMHKSVLISCTEQNIMELGWSGKIVNRGEIFRHLGYPIGVEVSHVKLVDWVSRKIENKFIYWRSQSWPFHIRVKVVQSIMIPMVSYYLPLLPWSKKAVEKITQSMRSLLWAKKGKHGISWLAWDHICTPKRLGGAALLNVYEHMVARRFSLLISMFGNTQPWVEMVIFFIERIGIKFGKVKVETHWWNVVNSKRQVKCSMSWVVDQLLSSWQNVLEFVKWDPPSHRQHANSLQLEILATSRLLHWESKQSLQHQFNRMARLGLVSLKDATLTSQRRLMAFRTARSTFGIPRNYRHIWDTLQGLSVLQGHVSHLNEDSPHLDWTFVGGNNLSMVSTNEVYHTIIGKHMWLENRVIMVWSFHRPTIWWKNVLQKGWCSHLSFRAKVFIWRVMVGGLPLGDALCKRKIANGFCFFCTVEVEHSRHRFISCPVTKMVWKFINAICRSLKGVIHSPFKWVFAQVELGGLSPSSQIILDYLRYYGLWFTWHMRNAFIFDEQRGVHRYVLRLKGFLLWQFSLLEMSSMFNHEERQVCKLVGHHIRHLVL